MRLLAAYLTAHGYGHDFFDPGLQDKLYVSLIPNLMPFDRYIDYPPYLGVVLLPLLLLAINNGYIVFTLLSVLFFFYSLYKLNNELGYLTKFNFIAYGFGVFACTLTMYNFEPDFGLVFWNGNAGFSRAVLQKAYIYLR